MRPHFKLTRFRTFSPKESQSASQLNIVMTPDEAALYKKAQSHLYFLRWLRSITSARQFLAFSMSLSWSVPSSALLHAELVGWGLQMPKDSTKLSARLLACGYLGELADGGVREANVVQDKDNTGQHLSLALWCNRQSMEHIQWVTDTTQMQLSIQEILPVCQLLYYWQRTKRTRSEWVRLRHPPPWHLRCFYTRIVWGTPFDWAGHAEKCYTFVWFGSFSYCTFFNARQRSIHHACCCDNTDAEQGNTCHFLSLVVCLCSHCKRIAPGLICKRNETLCFQMDQTLLFCSATECEHSHHSK